MTPSPSKRANRKTHCAQGHAFTPDNTAIRRNGVRTCITCRRAQMRRQRREEKHGGPVGGFVPPAPERRWCSQCERLPLAAEADQCASPWCKAKAA